MSRKITVSPCKPKVDKIAKFGSTKPMPPTKPIAGAPANVADESRQKLQAWSEKAKYKSISFWIPPDACASPDESLSEVANALDRFDREVASGNIKPVGDNDDNL